MGRNCVVYNSRFPRNCCGQPLWCPPRRLFFSIRTMEIIIHSSRFCFNFRNVYRDWKSKNEEFHLIIEHLEQESSSRERMLSHNVSAIGPSVMNSLMVVISVI